PTDGDRNSDQRLAAVDRAARRYAQLPSVAETLQQNRGCPPRIREAWVTLFNPPHAGETDDRVAESRSALPADADGDRVDAGGWSAGGIGTSLPACGIGSGAGSTAAGWAAGTDGAGAVSGGVIGAAAAAAPTPITGSFTEVSTFVSSLRA